MKQNIKGKTRLLLTLAICMIFISISISNAIGKLSYNQNYLTKEKDQVRIISSELKFYPLLLFNFRILNRDWDYWSDPPNLFSIVIGNVGIGTKNPEEKLHVADGFIKTNYGWGLSLEEQNGYTSNINTLGNDLYLTNFATGAIDISTDVIPNSAYTRLHISNNGKIGIGTNSPEVKLHISDDTPLIRFEETDQNNKMWNIGGFNSGIVFSEPGIADRMFIAQGGNVGIGTKNPAYKLDVEGYVQAYGYYTGDIIFQKNGKQLWRMYEDENGLYLQSLITGKHYKFVLKETNSMESDLYETIKNLLEENKQLKQRLDVIEQALGIK